MWDVTSANEIAEWLINRIRDNGRNRTYQQSAVEDLRSTFGDEWSYENHNGNWAISKAVLKAFRPLKDDHVIWDRSDQSWRVVDDKELAYLREQEERRKEYREQAKSYLR